MNFLNLNSESFGLDISDISLKIIKLKKNKGFLNKPDSLSLASFGEFKIKSGIITKGEIKDEKALLKIIKNAVLKVKGEKLKTNNVIVSLPEEKAFMQVIQMPKMKKEELKKAIYFEAENYIPIPIKDAYLDSQIVPAIYSHLDHLDVLIAAIPKKIVDPYVYCLKKAGLTPIAFEIESQAISRALIKKSISPVPVLLVDLGATRTSFMLFSGHSLRFTAFIPTSSKKLDEIISKTFKISLKEAEKIKTEYRFQRKTKKDKKIFKAILPWLDNLVSKIRKHLHFYNTHVTHEHISENKRMNIEKIIISGGGANLWELTDFLSQELKIKVEIGNPWINILPKPLKEVPELSYDKSLKYTTALGLALRGIESI